MDFREYLTGLTTCGIVKDTAYPTWPGIPSSLNLKNYSPPAAPSPEATIGYPMHAWQGKYETRPLVFDIE